MSYDLGFTWVSWDLCSHLLSGALNVTPSFCICGAEYVCALGGGWGVGRGLILGKSGEAAKAGAILSLPLLALLPLQPLCRSQAAVAQGLRQVWRGLFREQRELLAGDTSHPMNYFNARLDLQAQGKVIIGPIKLIYMDSMPWPLPKAVVGRLTHHTLAP